MNIRTKLEIMLSVLFVSACLAFGQSTECPPGCSHGRWSIDAIDLSSQRTKAPYETRDIRIYAPDYRKVVRILKDHWWVEAGSKKISLSGEPSELLYPAELAWAPDSQAFFITEGAGYSTGYSTDVYRITDDKLSVVKKLCGIVRKDFDRQHRCFDGWTGNAPNMAGLKWLGNSDRLLIIAEVPPIGICKESEYFGGYEILIGSGRIVERYSPQQVAERWGEMLGERLKSNLQALSADEKTRLP